MTMWRWRNGWRCWSFISERFGIMKSKKARSVPKAPLRQGRGPTGEQRVWVGLCAGAALIAFLWAYSPVMHTEFLFDDTKQVFALSSGTSSLRSWIGVIRPVLMATYWFNNQLGQDT